MASYSVEEELGSLERYKYSPSGMVNMSLDRLTRIVEGKVDIVDPNNPFIYLLETSCLNTAFAIQENTLLTRKLYPRLANDERDLYLHMSDYDYLGRFSEPAKAKVIFNILYADFYKNSILNSTTGERIFKIPRNTKLLIDGCIYTLFNPIIIKRAGNGVIDIKYDHTLGSDLFPLETNYIDFNIYSVGQDEKYINFSTEMKELDIEMVELPVEKSRLFNVSMNFNPNRLFYYLEAYYRLDGVWKKLVVTHTNEVYNIHEPSVCINVLQDNKTIECYVPPVYINTNVIQGKIKFLIYTTKGAIDINYNDYKIQDFKTEYNKVFPDLELDNYTAPLHTITKIVYIKGRVTCGKNNISFTELKQNVIDNSIGDRKLPITNKQVEYLAIQNNYRLIPNIDIVTSRIFGLEPTIPKASTKYPITKIDFDQMEYMTTLTDLSLSGAVVDITTKIKVIPEGTLFEIKDSSLRLLNITDAISLKTSSGSGLVDNVNKAKYLSTFYHYVLDCSEETAEFRAYELNTNEIKRINFKNYNNSCRIGVNTKSSLIAKTATGYQLDLECNYKKYAEGISYFDITPCLVYTDISGSNFYLIGHIFTVVNEQPVYRFYLNTDFYIDKKNKIVINNFTDANGSVMSINIDLESKLTILYLVGITPDAFSPIEEEGMIEGSYLANTKHVVTVEELSVKLGDVLTYLYKPVHTSASSNQYVKYDTDVLLRYDIDVYDNNGDLVHAKNEVVLDNNSNPVIQHHKGDPVLDNLGNNIPVGDLEVSRYMTLTFVDFKATVATKSTNKNYLDYLRSYLTTNITDNASAVQKQLVDRTEAYVTLPRTIATATVKVNNSLVRTINCNQSFVVDVYVLPAVYNNADLRENISYEIISTIAIYLEQSIILRKTEVLDILFNRLKEYIVNISISKFTELNAEYIDMLSNSTKMSINKFLEIDVEGYTLKEDVLVNYITV